jgi:molecular chaperone IbpA
MTRETLTLRSIDIPRVARVGVGFEQILEELLNTQTKSEVGYPPYNIIRETEDRYTIEVAVAGFDEGDITITVERRVLTVTGEQQSKPLEEVEYLHKGISNRDFKRSWPLADHVEVLGAQVRNGILSITLERQVPEEEKPKSVAINYVK